ncbi:MAG: nucleotidyltransferase family protein [Fusobacteriales bacterium]|jgi:predicted nucleotidyltransferase|nr:nucleotidyltransferase family protein [Fusobacteriales bacterium]
MRAGIVAEYNPFHNGHLYQIEETEKYSPKLVMTVVSGDFVQRGEFSFIDKWEKTEVALNNGIDLVVELPLYYSLQNAEVFCREALKILEYMEADIQIFGAETGDINKLNEVIQIQNTDSYARLLKKYLKNGESYSVSHHKALAEFGMGDFFLSNNILAMEYMKTIRKKGFHIKPYIVERKGTGYNETEITENITSASNIRKIYKEGRLAENRNVMPKEVYSIIKSKAEEDSSIEDRLYELFRYKILTCERKELEKVYDMSEDFLNRLFRQASCSNTYNSFTANMKSRNFSVSRIKRSILNVLLDIKEKDIQDSEPEYVRVLGFNQRGREHLHRLVKINKKEKIYTNWKDIEKLNNRKVKTEKNGFLLKELILKRKEKLNSIIKVR